VKESPDIEFLDVCPASAPIIQKPQTNALIKAMPQNPVLINRSDRCLLNTAMMFAVSELQLDNKATRSTSTGTFRRSSKCGPVSEAVASNKTLLVAEVGTRIIFGTRFVVAEVDASVTLSGFRCEPVLEDRNRPMPKNWEIMVSVSANASECSNTDIPTSVMTGCCCKAQDKVSVRCDSDKRRNVGQSREKEP
jgi:hypothetical protein